VLREELIEDACSTVCMRTAGKIVDLSQGYDDLALINSTTDGAAC
jgi:hypothetical protein